MNPMVRNEAEGSVANVEGVGGGGIRRGGFRVVARYFRRYRWKVALAATALGCAGILQLLFAYVAGDLVDGTMAHHAPELERAVVWASDIDVVGLAMLGILAGIILLTYVEMLLFGTVGERALADLRVDAFAHLIGAPMAVFGNRRGGEVSGWLLADLAVVQEFVTQDIRLALKYFILFVGSLAMMVGTSPRLALILLAILPGVVLVAVVFGRKIRIVSARAQDGLARSSVVADEALQGIGAVKAGVNERFEAARYRRAVGYFLGEALRGVRYRSLLVCSIIFVLLAAAVFFMWFGSREIQRGHLTPGEFTRFMFFVAFAGSSGGTLAAIFGKLQRALGSVQRVSEALGGPTEDLGDPGDPKWKGRRAEGKIEFRDVDFAYPNRQSARVLEGVRFQIRPGSLVALVGPSGSGKSTTISLLLRFFAPDRGEILLDGRDLADYPLWWLRSQFALVPQDVILHGGTLRDNIAYGRPEADDALVVEAAKKAEADGFIREFPEGYETRVGDRGAQLSGGQRQRIALARAILEGAAVLLLDEATSALDSESEGLIQAALDRFMEGRTALVIAHRLSTVRRADMILVMREGQIVESGTHDELLAAGGFYRDLCQGQLG